MIRIGTIAWLGVSIGWAQLSVPRAATTADETREASTPSNYAQQDNRLRAIPIEIEPPMTEERPAGESVSLAQLQHNVPKEARKQFARAARLSKAEDHEGAAKQLEAAVRLDPEFTEAYERLGIEYGDLNRPSDAAVIFRRVLELKPDSVRGHCFLGLALFQTGDRAQSEEQIRQGLNQSPANAVCQFLLGYVLVQQDATRADGLQHITNAARSLPFARKFLHTLR